MDMEFGMPGMLAVSKAGRDRGSLYVIIEEAGEYEIGRASCRERVY